MSTNLKVSILIPSYNAAPWIEAAVQSALEQTHPFCEVIVIDDGSSDGSPALLQAYNGKARILCRENRGGNPTRNELLRMATGDWIQYLDADDALLPEKIAEQMAVVASHPEAEVIYSPQIVEHHHGGRVSTDHWDPHDPGGNHDPWAYHLGWKLTQTGGALFRRQTMLAVGGWNEKQSRCQDNELYFRLLKHGARFERCAHAGSVYRRFEGGSVSTDNRTRLVGEILRLLDAGEGWLEERGQMTPRRRQAANQSRFNLARRVWTGDRAEALRILQRIRRSDRRFLPDILPETPASYRRVYRLLGFRGAESLAALKRSIRK